MNTTMVSIAVAALLMAATSASAGGWYGSIGGSVSFREDSSGAIQNAPTPGSTVRTENFFEPGVGGQLAIGHGFGPLRFEGELGYTRDSQQLYQALQPATGFIFADTHWKTFRMMANAYWDITHGPVQPYVGLGVGYAIRDVNYIAPRAPFPTEQPRLLVDDRDGAFAWQAMAGLAFKVNDRLAITTQYRWFKPGDFVGVDRRNEPASYEQSGGAIDVGLRMQF